jgi:hypothetical protein
MANKIANKLVVNATTEEDIEKFLSAIIGIENGEFLHIDFERILPTPKYLPDTLCDYEHKIALYYYLMTTGNEDMVDKLFTFPQLFSMDIYKDKTEKELSDYKIRGEKIFNIAQQCGSIDWYHWRISNWGTKWNAYETDIDSCRDGSVELYFCTANDGVIPIIEKLVEMFPNLEFFYKYADEVIACNCGEAYGVYGNASFNFTEDDSDEAMALYIECWREEWDKFTKTEYGWDWVD